MQRISELEKKYVLEALENEFSTSKNSIFTNRLEQSFAKRFNAKYAISHTNGTATMHTALTALGVKPGDEVIVPPLTMSSTALAVLHNGSLPVFADVEPDTYTLSAEAVEKAVTARTKAIITVSLYGLSPDYDALLAVCRKYGLYLIEDNAQCFLGEYKGRLVGEFGDFSSFSFQASKHMTCGEGGILTTNNEELADAARKFSSLGYAGVSAKQGKISRSDIQDPNYSRHVTLGMNCRMSEVNSAVSLGQLERLEELVEARVKVAELFHNAVEGCKALVPQRTPAEYKHSYWSFAVKLNSNAPEKDWYRFRDEFQKLGGDGFYAAWKLSYAEPLFQNSIQNKAGIWQRYQPGLCPNAEYLQSRLVQFKTNYWDIEEARKQANILARVLKDFKTT